jgi:quercetin dioxygenase-like cupin family protein
MRSQNRKGIAAVLLTLSSLLVAAAAGAQIGVTRNVLLQEEIDVPGYQTLLVEVTIAVGGREGRHRHAGTLIGRVIRGRLALELEGLPTEHYGPGDSLIIPPGQVHEGINEGDEPVIALATFIVPTDQPLTTQVD